MEAAHPRSPGDGTAVRGVAQFCGAPKRRSTEQDAEELSVDKLPCVFETVRPKANEKCLGKASIPALASTHHVYVEFDCPLSKTVKILDKRWEDSQWYGPPGEEEGNSGSAPWEL